MERRCLIELISDKLKEVWKNGQLRSLVCISLFLQIVLIFVGKVRKRNGKPILRFIVWCAYLLADWVATIALGVILNKLAGKPKKNAPLEDDLITFWAAFLLLHLGGPDTITAYSLEDNQLWQRRLLELVFQMIVVLFIYLLAFPGFSFLSLLTIPMLLAGLIKSGERLHCLRLASTEQFRRSLMTEPDPGPNYSKFMEEFTLKKAEGFYVKAFEVIETSLPTCTETSIQDEELVRKAFHLFKKFQCLFVDLILSFQDRDESQCFFHKIDCEKAFQVIEIELGFAYDVFYTKAPAVYGGWGHILRLMTISATLISLATFLAKSKKDHFQKIDLFITYVLLVAAIILEVCSCLIFVSSDWPDRWLKKHVKKKIRRLFGAPKKRWSNSIAQYSIQNFCRKEQSSFFSRNVKLLIAENKLDELRYVSYSNVSTDLKKLIFEEFLEISTNGNKSDLTALCKSRGKRVLEMKKFKCSDLNWSTTEVEFDQSILLWHIATELCYYSDDVSETIKCKESSKYMSEYMLYLLALCPFMLPMGIGLIRFRDTCAEAMQFFKEKTEQPDRAQACKMLLRVNTEIPPGNFSFSFHVLSNNFID